MTKRITVVPYDPKWPEMFDTEAQVIKAALGNNLVAIHHVGSTSVPGLAAKPKIDIIVVIEDQTQVIEPLEKAGYEYRGEFNIPFQQGFSKREGDFPVNLHVFEKNNPEIHLNLMFRDYLRSHPEERDQYAKLKLELVSQEELHKRVQGRFSGYNLGKDKLIKAILTKAGFQGTCIRFCVHYDEWETARHFRQKYFFDKLTIEDPYTWTFNHEGHVHLILYKGTEIVGYAHIQLWPEQRAALRIIVTDETHRNQGFGGHFLMLCEKWLKQQGILKLQVESSPEAYSFYQKHNYVEMPFNNPDGELTHPKDIAMGKVL